MRQPSLFRPQHLLMVRTKVMPVILSSEGDACHPFISPVSLPSPETAKVLSLNQLTSRFNRIRTGYLVAPFLVAIATLGEAKVIQMSTERCRRQANVPERGSRDQREAWPGKSARLNSYLRKEGGARARRGLLPRALIGADQRELLTCWPQTGLRRVLPVRPGPTQGHSSERTSVWWTAPARKPAPAPEAVPVPGLR